MAPENGYGAVQAGSVFRVEARSSRLEAGMRMVVNHLIFENSDLRSGNVRRKVLLTVRVEDIDDHPHLPWLLLSHQIQESRSHEYSMASISTPVPEVRGHEI